MKRILCLGFGLSMVLGGCAPETRSVGVSVSDSAGIAVVEYSGWPPSEDSLRLSGTPLFRHGHREGDFLFQNVRAGVLLPGGGAAVGDLGARHVVLLTAGGEFSRTVGTPGEGPGEFGSIESVNLLGDGSIVVEDDGNARFTVFTGDSLTRTVSLSDAQMTFLLHVIGATEDDDLLLSTAGFRPGFDEDWLRGSIVRFEMDEERADTIARYDYLPRQESGPANPFRPQGEVAAAGGEIILGRSDRAELQWLDANGNIRQIVRWTAPERTPTDSLWSAFEAAIRQNTPAQMPEDRLNRQLEEWREGAAGVLPVFGLLRGAQNGDVWISQYTPATDEIGTYQVVSSDGTWLGAVHVPGAFRVLDITEDRVLGVLRDSLDVQSIAVYRLLRGEAL